jgi:hypothetical protein
MGGQPGMKRSVRIILAGAATVAALGIGGNMAAAGGFDSQKWKAERGNETSKNPRVTMVGEAEKLLRVGMTREEVTALLGEPDGNANTRFEYLLGISPVGIDFEVFIIEFDAQGKLVRFRTERG